MGEQLRRGRFACTPAVVASWAGLSHDHNPLHLDAQFAATTRFGVPIAHGHLLAAVVANEVESVLGERLASGGSVTVSFRAPVPVGSTLEVLTLGGGEAGAWSRASVAGSDVLSIEVEESRR